MTTKCDDCIYYTRDVILCNECKKILCKDCVDINNGKNHCFECSFYYNLYPPKYWKIYTQSKL